MEEYSFDINRGINKPVEFRGLKAQYIAYLAITLAVLLIAFAAMYIAGVPALLCVCTICAAGTIATLKIYRLNRQYGQYGMMKKIAQRSVPKQIQSRSRKLFFKQLKP